MEIVLTITWYIVGVTGFLYWGTKDYKLSKTDLLFSLVVGVSGPLAWIIGHRIHNKINKL